MPFFCRNGGGDDEGQGLQHEPRLESLTLGPKEAGNSELEYTQAMSKSLYSAGDRHTNCSVLFFSSIRPNWPTNLAVTRMWSFRKDWKLASTG